MYGISSNGGSMSQGASNARDGRKLNEPVWFTQTLGIFGSVVTNK